MSVRATSSSPALNEILCCPDCQRDLRQPTPDRLECSACEAEYPVYDGIPWLYRDVAGSRAQWAAKLQLFRNDLLAEHAEIEEALANGALLTATRERLTRHKAGLERMGEQVFGLLEVFAFAHSEAGGAIPKDRIPSQQHVSSYLETVFRDWCWGEREVAQTLQMLERLLGSAGEGGHALVLGGGGGRLCYELARRPGFRSVVQLDLNPLLTRIGQQVAGGRSIELTEIPRFAAGVEHVAVDQRLAAPPPNESTGAVDGGVAASTAHYMLGDMFAVPFREACFDLLVTPWFVDILPESFRVVARRLGAMLAPGGRWISFGPLSFEALDPDERFVPEEMLEALEEAGFRVEHSGLERVDYLHSPHGMQRRGEEIFVFAATRGELRPVEEEYAYYPAWMTDGRQPIPVLPELEQLRAERIFDVEILKCIDGRASIEDIVVILSNRYGLAPDRCRNTVNRFFGKLIEGD